MMARVLGPARNHPLIRAEPLKRSTLHRLATIAIPDSAGPAIRRLAALPAHASAPIFPEIVSHESSSVSGPSPDSTVFSLND